MSISLYVPPRYYRGEDELIIIWQNTARRPGLINALIFNIKIATDGL